MKDFIKLNIYFFPLTILLSSITILPNRISLAIVLLYLIYKDKYELIKYILKNKYYLLIAGGIILMVSIYNDVIFSEILLFLSLPIYIHIYKYNNFFERDMLKKYFCYSNLIFLFIILISKFISIYNTGFNGFFNNGFWWNKIIYLNLVEPIYGHPMYISLFVLVSLVFLLNQMINNRWFFSKTSTFFVFLFQFLFLILLSVKMAFISLGVSLILFIIWMIKSGNLKVAIVISLTTILFTFILINSLPSIKYRWKIDFLKIQNKERILDTDSKFSERLALWKSSIDLIKENPIIGSSLRNIKSKDAIYEKVPKINSYTKKAKNSHNNFLEFGVRYGLIGFITILFLSIYVLYIGVKQNSYLIIAISSVFILFSLTESFLVREQGVMLLAITIGLTYKEINDERSI
jgi:O-antigen ligase